MGNSGYTCVRYIFCYLNIVLWLSSCGLLGVGAWLYAAHGAGYATLLPQYSLAGADSLLVALGAALFAVTFFGCCGSWCQSRCLLVTYFTLVILLFVFEFALATLAFAFRDRLGLAVRDELLDGIERYYRNPAVQDNGIELIWDRIQTKFQCCGVTSYEDWFDIRAWPEKKFVPDSCCVETIANVTDQSAISIVIVAPAAAVGCGQPSAAEYDPESSWWTKGCSEQIQMWLVQRLYVVGIVGLVISFVQLFGLISSMLLFCSVRHKRTSHTYKSYDTAS